MARGDVTHNGWIISTEMLRSEQAREKRSCMLPADSSSLCGGVDNPSWVGWMNVVSPWAFKTFLSDATVGLLTTVVVIS